MIKSDKSISRTSGQVKKHFDKKYKEFDAFYNERKGLLSKWIDTLFRRSMRLRFEKVIKNVAPYENKSVLDVGCGTGRYSIALAIKGVKKSLGIDFAENMIGEAIKRARLFKVDHICRFLRIDFKDFDVEEAVDHTFAMGVLDYIDNPTDFVKKMIQTARLSVMISFPSAGGIIQWFRRHYFQRIKKCPVFFYSKEDVRQIAHQAIGNRNTITFTIKKLAKDYFLTILINN